MGLSVRRIQWPIAADEFDQIDEILMRAYLTASRRARVQRFLQADNGMWVVAEEDARVIGVGGAIGYPTGGFGWIGLIATDPSHGRRGAGAAITRHLFEELSVLGCASVLDGSAQGAPLYERLGFVDHGTTVRFLPPPRASAPRTVGSTNVISLGASDIESLVRFDATVFGASRGSLLSILMSDHAGHAFGVFDKHGRVTGYAIAQHDTIGPVAASSEDD